MKPLSLLKWLCTLLTPPPEYAPRRLLVPFSGSGSEIAGAILSGGWEEIVGIEQDAEYCRIAEARCRFWQDATQETGLTEPKEMLKMLAAIEAERKRAEEERQMGFDMEETDEH